MQPPFSAAAVSAGASSNGLGREVSLRAALSREGSSAAADAAAAAAPFQSIIQQHLQQLTNRAYGFEHWQREAPGAGEAMRVASSLSSSLNYSHEVAEEGKAAAEAAARARAGAAAAAAAAAGTPWTHGGENPFFLPQETDMEVDQTRGVWTR